MLRSITVRNYRCFNDLTLNQLARVNLVAGMNNVGKSALLEAIYLILAPHLPEWPTRISMLRGFESLLQEVDLETRWGWLFNKKSSDAPIEITAEEDDGIARALSVSWDVWRETVVRFGETHEVQQDTKRPHLLLLTFTASNGDKFQMSVSSSGFTRPEINTRPETSLKTISLGVLSGRTIGRPEDDASLFSKLMQVGRHHHVVDALKIVEPRLTQLSVLYLSGVPMIYGDIGMGQLVPLPQMGEGIGRILSLVLEIAKARHGILLVDEVEHGLHHSVLMKVWGAVIQAARSNDTQVFATTHSWECIQAAHDAFTAAGRHDFRLHRLEHIKGEIQAITYDEESLDAALKFELEVR